MIDWTIKAPRPFPWAALVLGLLAAALVALAVLFKSVHWVVASVLPFFVSLFLWRSRRAAFAAHFTESTVEVMQPAMSIPYAKIEAITTRASLGARARRRRRSFPISVWHEEGVLRIPGGLNVPSADVYDFLYGQLPPGGSREVNPALAEYLCRQEETFGQQKVFSYRARRHLGSGRSSARARAVSLAVLLSGLVWACTAIAGLEFLPWSVTGILLAFVGGLFYFVFWLEGRRASKLFRDWRQSSLVISPVGLGMIQGDMKGELRWDEVLDVRLNTKRHGGFQVSSEVLSPSVIVRVEGGQIVIADIYDRPLSVIYEKISRYCK